MNRDRDSYEVAKAFAEAGELDQLVTDYYHESFPLRISSLEHRRSELIPPLKVTNSFRAFFSQFPYEIKRRIGHADFPSEVVEGQLGRTVAAVASKSLDSDLMLYSGSALQAFQGPSRGKRILFQYHPSPSFIESSMVGIDELAEARPWIQEAEVSSVAMESHHRAEVALADRFVCASDFTKRGLESVGVPAENIVVAPYGCPDPGEVIEVEPTETVRFLFVGQGVQRKGLHLLLEAWRRAELPNAHLRVVASRLDPEMPGFAEGLGNVEISSRVSREELKKLMSEADTFVLPSLVEGFGLVLGEALSNGARLIASTNTGLVNMDLPEELKTVVEAGKVQPLVEALKKAHATYDPQRPYRRTALEMARTNSWAKFREDIRASVADLPKEK